MLTQFVTDTSFNFQTAPHNLTQTLNEDAGSEISIEDFVLHHLSGNADIDREDLSFAYDSPTKTSTIAFPGLSNSGLSGMLADGNYDLILNDFSIPDLTGESTYSFFHLIADLNHDRAIGWNDFSTLSSNFNQSGDWSDGDINGDGVVNMTDYSILSANYGRQIPAPITAANSITCYALSESEIRLNWSAPSSGSWDGFRVFVSADGVDYTQIAEVGPTTYTYDASSLQDGTKYWFRVRPYTTANGNGASTNETWAPTVLPAPSDLTATPVVDDDGSAVILSWQPNATNVGTFILERATNSTFTQGLVEIDIGFDSSMTFRDSTALGVNYYRIRATNSATTSAYSLSASAERGTAPPESIATGVGVSLSATETQLKWSDPSSAETGIRIERATNSDFTDNYSVVTTTAANATSYNDTVPGAGEYWYRLTTMQDTTPARRSAVFSVSTVQTTPSAPTNLELNELPDENLIEWNDTSNSEDGFEIERATDSNFTQNVTVLGTTDPNTTHFSDKTIAPNTSYWYRARAVKMQLKSDAAELPASERAASSTDVQFEVLTHNNGTWVSRSATSTEIGQYIAGIPIHVRVRLSTISKPDFGAFKPRYVWDFNDTPSQSGKFNTVQGFNAAHVYNETGTRRITLRVELAPIDENGNPVSESAENPIRVFSKHLDITVNADPRTASGSTATWNVVKVTSASSAGSGEITLEQLKASPSTYILDNTRLQFKRGVSAYTFTVNKSNGNRNALNLLGKNNLIIESFGTGSLPQLRVTTNSEGETDPNYFFGTTTGQRNLLFKDILFDSTFSESYASSDGTTTTATWQAPAVTRVQGKNVAFIDCTFGHLSRVMENTAPNGTTGILLQGNVTAKTGSVFIALKGYTLFTENVDNIVAQGNQLVDSHAQSVFRFNESNQYINIWSNDEIRWREGGGGRERKSPLRLMAGRVDSTGAVQRALFYAAANTFRGGENWLGPIPDTSVNPDGTLRVEGGSFTNSAIIDRNIYDDSTLRLNLGLQTAVIRNNVFRNAPDRAIFVKGEIPTYVNSQNQTLPARGASEVVQDVLVAHNTFNVPGGTNNIQDRTTAFFRFDSGGRPDTHIRVKKLRLINNLVTTTGSIVKPAAIILNALTSPATTWASAIGTGTGTANWTVRGNAWATSPTAQFGWDRANPNKTVAQWRTQTGSTTDEDVKVTINATSFLPSLGTGETTLELSGRVDEAWFDRNGAARPVSGGKVTAGAVKRT